MLFKGKLSLVNNVEINWEQLIVSWDNIMFQFCPSLGIKYLGILFLWIFIGWKKNFCGNPSSLCLNLNISGHCLSKSICIKKHQNLSSTCYYQKSGKKLICALHLPTHPQSCAHLLIYEISIWWFSLVQGIYWLWNWGSYGNIMCNSIVNNLGIQVG